MRILVAEDDFYFRKWLRVTLEGLGHEVTEVWDGNEALSLLKKRHFPLLVTDWRMPGRDGLEIVRAVREHSSGPYTYAILVTGVEGREQVLAAMSAGVDDYVMKPCDTALLISRLQAAEIVLRSKSEQESRRLALLGDSN
jgi:CheY-like chemotaxis protein